jgi:hypothetical protein
VVSSDGSTEQQAACSGGGLLAQHARGDLTQAPEQL